MALGEWSALAPWSGRTTVCAWTTGARGSAPTCALSRCGSNISVSVAVPAFAGASTTGSAAT